MAKIAVRDVEPGMDARMPCETFDGQPLDARTSRAMSLLLAELHPDTLQYAPRHVSAAVGMADAVGGGWSDFFCRAHRVLPAGGLLLLATRQRRDSGRLIDPLGTLITCARTAGFRYLQHIVVVHAQPVGERLVPAPPADAPPGLVHSDLLAFTAIHAQA
ncbi:hypothetical protein [Streptomyces sp. N35]|uniref:hypothetical protein n=1 Tax=Streptomyces sp. N35 TaxID=2795730 RepID=UPI001F3E212D|nr:hypothetical protein [Streptomyces sp. N35]